MTAPVVDQEELVARFAGLIDTLGGAGPALQHLLGEARTQGAAEIPLAAVRRLRLGPGDVLILQFRATVPEDVRNRLGQQLVPHLGGATVLVLDDTVGAVVAREGQA